MKLAPVPVTAVIVALAACSLLAQDTGKPPRVERVDMGEHWHGREISRKDLVGKVVLLVRWGTCSSCRPMTPYLVKLAKRLENRPFHLIGANAQDITREQLLADLKKNKLSPWTPNFTVLGHGGHPRVEGTGYVPYYMVFDHHGNLIHDHVCGGKHGGDGLLMIKLVDQLLETTPDIYLGEEPFTAVPDLADAIAFRKNMAETVKTLEARLAYEGPAGACREELERLHAAMTTYRDTAVRNIERFQLHHPEQTLPALKSLARELDGSSYAAPVKARISELEGSESQRNAIRIGMNFWKITARLEKRKACRECRLMGVRKVDVTCEECFHDNKKSFEKTRKKLEKLIQGHETLRITATVKQYLKKMRS